MLKGTPIETVCPKRDVEQIEKDEHGLSANGPTIIAFLNLIDQANQMPSKSVNCIEHSTLSFSLSLPYDGNVSVFTFQIRLYTSIVQFVHPSINVWPLYRSPFQLQSFQATINNRNQQFTIKLN